MILNRQDYQRKNESFSPVLAYRLGRRSGFFSEYLTMLQAILYCLQEDIQFQLFSKDANFAMREGWTDFFEPFCPEQTSPLHLVFNPRFPTPKFRFKLRKFAAPIIKILCDCDYLTYELWSKLRATDFDNTSIHLTAFDHQSSAIQIYRELNQMIWRLKPEVHRHIDTLLNNINLPNSYCAVHIRSGDKIKEADPYSIHAYMEKIKEISDTENVLVLTDDYSNYTALVKNYPKFNFYTLESAKLKGYYHRAHKRQSPEDKQSNYLNFLAGIEAATNAGAYLGTNSSNVSTFIRLKMDANKYHAIDRSKN